MAGGNRRDVQRWRIIPQLHPCPQNGMLKGGMDSPIMKTRFRRDPLIIGCVSTAGGLRRCARRRPAFCDMVEVRLDMTGLCGGDWQTLCGAIQQSGMPVLLTIRSPAEGGHWTGRESERLALYSAGFSSVSAVDLEIRSHAFQLLAKKAHRSGIKVVGSFHDFHRTPELACLQQIVVKGRRLGADVVKIATMVRTSRDLARLFAVPYKVSGRVCVMGMGSRGMISRVALPGAGSCLAYGALNASTAPGQLPVRRLAWELAHWGIRQA